MNNRHFFQKRRTKHQNTLYAAQSYGILQTLSLDINQTLFRKRRTPSEYSKLSAFSRFDSLLLRSSLQLLVSQSYCKSILSNVFVIDLFYRRCCLSSVFFLTKKLFRSTLHDLPVGPRCPHRAIDRLGPSGHAVSIGRSSEILTA